MKPDIYIYLFIFICVIFIIIPVYYINKTTQKQETQIPTTTTKIPTTTTKIPATTTQIPTTTTQIPTTTQQEETPCDKFARISEDVVKKYDDAKTEWDYFNKIQYSDYLNNTGKFSKYKDYGTSKYFTIQYGGTNWDPNNACAECATGKYPFFNSDPASGNSNYTGKFGGGAFCQMDDAVQGVSLNLLNGSKYAKRADGGGQGNGRYWWSCSKPSDVINDEIIEKQKNIPKLPNSLSTYVDTKMYDNGNIESYNFKSLVLPNFEATCCSQRFQGIDASQVIIDKINQQCGK